MLHVSLLVVDACFSLRTSFSLPCCGVDSVAFSSFLWRNCFRPGRSRARITNLNGLHFASRAQCACFYDIRGVFENGRLNLCVIYIRKICASLLINICMRKIPCGVLSFSRVRLGLSKFIPILSSFAWMMHAVFMASPPCTPCILTLKKRNNVRRVRLILHDAVDGTAGTTANMVQS